MGHRGDNLYATFMSGGTGSYQAYFEQNRLGSNTLCSIEPLTGNIPGLESTKLSAHCKRWVSHRHRMEAIGEW